MVGEEITEEEGEIQEVVEEDSVEVEAGVTIDLVVAVVEVVEIGVSTEGEEEESIEDAGEEDLLAEVDTGRGHPMVEVVEIDMRAEVLHQLPPSVERETTIETREEDLHQGMDLQEDHHHLLGTIMGHLVEIMGDLLLLVPLGDLMREADPAVEAGMRRATPAEVPHHPQGTGTGAGVLWQAETHHLTQAVQDQENDILQAPAILAPAEALELVEIIEVVAPIMEEEEEDTKTTKEVKEDSVEEVTNPPPELLPEMITLKAGVKGVI